MAPNDMKQPPDTPDSATPQAAGLGQQAEEALAEDPATIQKMFRELEAHLIEIEMRDEELRRTHAQLAASHARYLDHYELAPVGFVTVSDAGLILEANPAASALLGIARAELIGQPLTRFIFSEHPPPYFQYHSQIFATGTTQTREVRMRDRDGGPSWVLVSATAHDGGGQPLWRVVLTDITGLKQAEARLRESEERFRLLVEQTPDGIFVADSGGRYTDVNQAGAEMLGYTREEILRLTFTDVLAATEIPRLPSQLAALASGTVTRNEWGFRRKDGSEFCGEVVGRQLPDGAFQGILRDITERKRVEEALRESRDELARFNSFMVGRELRMLELKREINSLCAAAGEAPRYQVEELL